MEGVPVELARTEDHAFDLEAILGAITDKTKLVIVCNPNNPTGTIVEGDKLRSFLKQLPKHVIAVLDEAYIEFVNIDNYPALMLAVARRLPAYHRQIKEEKWDPLDTLPIHRFCHHTIGLLGFGRSCPKAEAIWRSSADS